METIFMVSCRKSDGAHCKEGIVRIVDSLGAEPLEGERKIVVYAAPVDPVYVRENWANFVPVILATAYACLEAGVKIVEKARFLE
jgi:hypothetical protein